MQILDQQQAEMVSGGVIVAAITAAAAIGPDQ